MENINFKESLGHLFHSINIKMRKKLDKKIREFGLTSSHQFGVLIILSKSKELTQKQIADATFGDEPTTTRMIAKLIKSNFIKKEKKPNDKREQLVSLTTNGKILLSELVPLAIEGNKDIEPIKNNKIILDQYDIEAIKKAKEILQICKIHQASPNSHEW